MYNQNGPAGYPSLNQQRQQGSPRRQHNDSEGDSDDGALCGGMDDDEHDGRFNKSTFDQGLPASVRAGFIRKVYGILVVQLIITVLIAAPFRGMPREWLRANMWLYYLCMFGSLAVICVLGCPCTQSFAKVFPNNYLLLLGFTCMEAVLLGFVTSMYETNSVLLALTITTLVFLSLTAYACLTKTDFSGIGPYLYAALMVGLISMFVISIVSYFTGIPRVVDIVIGVAGTLLFSMYIIYDTQLIVGKGKHALTPDDYVLGALNLYLDIVNLFLCILSLLGGRNN